MPKPHGSAGRIDRRWRRYFRNLFEQRFEPQADSIYIARWIAARGQPATLYRVDAALKEQMVAALVKGSVIATAPFDVQIIGITRNQMSFGRCRWQSSAPSGRRGGGANMDLSDLRANRSSPPPPPFFWPTELSAD